MNSSNTTIYLLRHGKVNGPAALYGKTDIEVADKVNAKILAELNSFQANSAHNITQIISSPLQRCYNIASQFSKAQYLPLESNKGFAEIDFGKYDGVSFDEIQNLKNNQNIWQQLENFWNNPSSHPLPDAELLSCFYQRITDSWKQMLKAHKGKNILLVCHGGVIRMILSHLLNIDYDNKALFSQLNVKNSSITLIKNIQTATDEHNNVMAISTPLKCLSLAPEEFE